MLDEARLIEAACRKAGCKKRDLLKSRLTAEHVVLIIGPAGRKVVIEISELEPEPEEKKAPAPVKPTHAEDAVQQVTPPKKK